MLGLLLVAMVTLPFSFSVYAADTGQGTVSGSSQTLDESQSTGSIALTLQVVDNRKPDVVIVPKTPTDEQTGGIKSDTDTTGSLTVSPLSKTLRNIAGKLPQTSDSSHIMLLLILMTAACSALTLLAVYRDEESSR